MSPLKCFDPHEDKNYDSLCSVQACKLYCHFLEKKKNPNYGLGSNFSEQSMSWRVEKGDTTQLKSQQTFSLLLPLFVLYMLAFRNI